MEIDELFELRETKRTGDTDWRIIDLLLQAISDWPYSIDTVEIYLCKVKSFLRSDCLNYKIIENELKRKITGATLWEFESLSSLLEIAEINKDSDIEGILQWYNIMY